MKTGELMKYRSLVKEEDSESFTQSLNDAMDRMEEGAQPAPCGGGRS
jgi:hypothetical protein